MLIRRAAATGVFVLAGATTAWGVACSFETDPFVNATRPDTSTTPVDSSKLDSVAVDSTLDVRDTKVTDSTMTETADSADTKPLVDTGPPTTFPAKCSEVGPPETACIPKTTFSLGAASGTACPPTGCAHELPEVTVTVNQFHIDLHEVTVKRFRAWWNLSPRPWPATNAAIFTSPSKDVKWRAMWPTAPTEPPASGCTWLGATNAANDDKPINCVDWFTALGFCMSEGKRLPTEAEFELAAGGDDRLFPWSDPGTEDFPFKDSDVECVHALKGTCTPFTSAASSTVWGRSKYGVWNLAGSLSEWTLDAHTTSYAAVLADSVDPVTDPSATNSRITRGGSHANGAAALRIAARPLTAVTATSPDSQIGFRCAKRL